MLEVHLEWQLPGDAEFTKLIVKLKPNAQDDAKLDAFYAGFGAAVEAHPELTHTAQLPTSGESAVVSQDAPVDAYLDTLKPAPIPPSVYQRPTLPDYTGPRMEKNHATAKDIREIKSLLRAGYSHVEIARATRFAATTIGRIARNEHRPRRGPARQK